MSSITAGSHAHDDAHGHAHGGSASFLRTYVFSLDHKVIGIQFLFSTLLWFVVGGLLALAVRWQLAWPWSDMPIVGRLLFSGEGGAISPEFYTMLVTMHATVMIFFVIIPILAGAFGNYLIPLMIGADDMAFPTLNMLSYWFMWPAFFAMITAFFVEGGGAAAAPAAVHWSRGRRPAGQHRVLQEQPPVPPDSHPTAVPAGCPRWAGATCWQAGECREGSEHSGADAPIRISSRHRE